MAADSGRLVNAVNVDVTGNVSITVDENGKLETQDPSSYTQVVY